MTLNKQLPWTTEWVNLSVVWVVLPFKQSTEKAWNNSAQHLWTHSSKANMAAPIHREKVVNTKQNKTPTKNSLTHYGSAKVVFFCLFFAHVAISSSVLFFLFFFPHRKLIVRQTRLSWSFTSPICVPQLDSVMTVGQILLASCLQPSVWWRGGGSGGPVNRVVSLVLEQIQSFSG